MNWKNLITKSISLLLIASGFYHVFLSLEAIVFIYPRLGPEIKSFSFALQEGLIEKALVLYLTMLIDGTYGVILLFKPSREVKVIHIVAGVLIAIVSIFFVTQTSFTTNPVTSLILWLTR